MVGSIAAIAGFLVAGLFEYNFGDSEVAMLAYAVMALAFAASWPVAGAECGAGKCARHPFWGCPSTFRLDFPKCGWWTWAESASRC